MSGRILDASWNILLTCGFEGFTFDRVARHAHIGKATIYSRFPGKTELMRALLERRIAQRTEYLLAQGSDLPVEQAFRLRASDTMSVLLAPDGIMTERLIDWLDQETGQGRIVRARAYRNAIEAIAQSLRDAAADPERAARLWFEGMIGHAKVAFHEGASSPADIERWAEDYTRFFFAGLRKLDRTD